MSKVLPRILTIGFLLLQTSSLATAEPRIIDRFLTFDYDGEKIFMGVQVESERKAQQIKKGVRELLLRDIQLWFSWQEKNGLTTQINQSLAREEGMILPAYILTYIKKLKDLALQSEHFYNPTLKRLLTLPQKLESNNKQFSFSQIEFFKGAIFSNNPNLQLDLEISHAGYLMQNIQDLLKKLKVRNAFIEHRQHVLFLGNSRKSKIIPDSDFSSVDLCNGESLSIRQGIPTKITWQGKEYYMARLTQDFQQAQLKVAVIHSDPIVADTASYAILGAGENWQKVADLLDIEQFMVINKNEKYISPELRYKRQGSTRCQKL